MPPFIDDRCVHRAGERVRREECGSSARWLFSRARGAGTDWGLRPLSLPPHTPASHRYSGDDTYTPKRLLPAHKNEHTPAVRHMFSSMAPIMCHHDLGPHWYMTDAMFRSCENYCKSKLLNWKRTLMWIRVYYTTKLPALISLNVNMATWEPLVFECVQNPIIYMCMYKATTWPGTSSHHRNQVL